MGVSLCHKMMCCICSVSGLHFLYIYYFFYCCFLCSLCGSGCLLSFWLSSVVHWWACLATEGSEVWLSWSIMSNSIHRSGCHGPFSSIHVWLPWSVMSSYIHEITQYSSPLSLYVYNLALLCVRMSVRDSMARDSTLLPLHRACTEGGFIPLLGCCEAAESTGHIDCQLSRYLFTNQFRIFCKYIACLHVLFYCDWIMLWYGFCLGTREYCYPIDSKYSKWYMFWFHFVGVWLFYKIVFLMNDDALTASKNVWSFKSNKCQRDVWLSCNEMKMLSFFFFLWMPVSARTHTQF